MRTLKITLLWLCLLVPLPVPARANPVDQNLLASVRRLAFEYLDAQLQLDIGRMDTLLDAQFQIVVYTPNGLRTTNKAEVLAAMKHGHRMSPKIMVPDATVIEVVGSAATVKATTRDRVELLTIFLNGSYQKIVYSFVQPRIVEFR